MKKWLSENLVAIFVALCQVLFTVAVCAVAWGSISTRVEANTTEIREIKDDAKLNRNDIVEMKGDIKTLLERTKDQ